MTIRDFATKNCITTAAVYKRIKMGQLAAHRVGKSWVVDVEGEDKGQPSKAPVNAAPGLDSLDELKRRKLQLELGRSEMEAEETKEALRLEGYDKALEDIAEILSKLRKALERCKMSRDQLASLQGEIDAATNDILGRTVSGRQPAA